MSRMRLVVGIALGAQAGIGLAAPAPNLVRSDFCRLRDGQFPTNAGQNSKTPKLSNVTDRPHDLVGGAIREPVIG